MMHAASIQNKVSGADEQTLTSCKMSSSFGITQSCSEASLGEGRERIRVNVRERERENSDGISQEFNI